MTFSKECGVMTLTLVFCIVLDNLFNFSQSHVFISKTGLIITPTIDTSQDYFENCMSQNR